MRTFLLLAFVFFTGFCKAQDAERVLIDGQVNVPVGQDASGVVVFNTTSGKGTVTRADGSFRVRVAPGDELQFSAVQYEAFVIVIDQTILDAGELNVFISESITELPEVTIGTPDLSGNVEVDARRIPVEVPELPAESAADINEYEWEFRPDERTPPRNAAMRSSLMRNGLNFANLFRSIYSSYVTGSGNSEPLEADVRDLYDDAFFRENLNIAQENISDFLLYAQQHGLDEELLEEGNQLDLIEFLIKTSREYKLETARRQ